MTRKLILVIGVLVISAGLAWSAPVSIVNPSFEADVLPPDGTTGNYDGYAPPGWTCESGVSGVYNGFSAPDGSNVWIKFGAQGYSEQGINQLLTATLQPNTVYTYSVDVLAGGRDITHSGWWYIGNEVALAAGSGLYLYSYNMGYNRGTYVYTGTLVNGAIPGVSSTNLGPDPITLDRWYTVAMQFTTGDPGTDPNFGEQIKLFLRIGEGDGTWTAFDNVRLDATPTNVVPEPSSLAAIGTGMMGLLGLVRRKVR